MDGEEHEVATDTMSGKALILKSCFPFLCFVWLFQTLSYNTTCLLEASV